MATAITIDNAVGTELVIPPAGTERRGVITISANNGFFSVNRTDNVIHSMEKNYALNSAGATITGLPRATLNNNFLWFPYAERGDKPFKLWGAIFSGEGSWGSFTYNNGNNATIHGLTNNDSGIDNLTNVYGDTFNGARILGDTANNKYGYTDYISYFIGGKTTDKFKLLTNVYIEEDTFSADGHLMTPFWNIQILRDGYKLWDGSNLGDKIAYKDNYKIPAQEWAGIEIDFINPNTGASSGVVSLKINGTDQEITPNNHSGGGSAIYLVGGTNADTANDYVRYSPIYMVNYDLVERRLGTDAKNEVITTIKNLITPV